MCESFEVDPKTIRRWGKALRQGDPVELVRVLEGRGAGRKLTGAIKNFARLRWPDLVAQRSYGAVGRLLGEIQGVFGLRISRSAVNELIRELKSGTVKSALREEDPSARLASPEMEDTMADARNSISLDKMFSHNVGCRLD
jgi:hypothetical protein